MLTREVAPPLEGRPEKDRIEHGLAWLLGTIAALALCYLLDEWAYSIPVIADPSDTYGCTFHIATSATVLQWLSSLLVLLGGFSAFAGLVLASGWRWWFLPCVLVSPILLLFSVLATFHVPPGCPGPFS